MAKPPEKPRKPRRPKGFGEAQAAFGIIGVELTPLFAAYGYRCAFTGRDLRAEVAADPHGALVRLRVASNAPGDVIPACLDAIHAFERGHLALGMRYQFLVAKDVIDPEFEERLRPAGKLELPNETAFYPDAKLLQLHRRAFAEATSER